MPLLPVLQGQEDIIYKPHFTGVATEVQRGNDLLGTA